MPGFFYEHSWKMTKNIVIISLQNIDNLYPHRPKAPLSQEIYTIA